MAAARNVINEERFLGRSGVQIVHVADGIVRKIGGQVVILIPNPREDLRMIAEQIRLPLFKGKFDTGWEKMREEIFANQKRLVVVPPNAQLTPWPDDLPKWDSLSEVQKKLFAHQAEVYAGYTAYTDYEIGRVIQAVQDMGKLDNTLIIYIDGDNGTSPEGSLSGTYNQLTAYNGAMDVPMPLQLLHYNEWGLTRLIRTWRCRGRGPSIPRSNGTSR